jgi:hypothetical protein
MNKRRWKALAKKLEDDRNASEFERLVQKRMEAEGGSYILNMGTR